MEIARKSLQDRSNTRQSLKHRSISPRKSPELASTIVSKSLENHSLIDRNYNITQQPYKSVHWNIFKRTKEAHSIKVHACQSLNATRIRDPTSGHLRTLHARKLCPISENTYQSPSLFRVPTPPTPPSLISPNSTTN